MLPDPMVILHILPLQQHHRTLVHRQDVNGYVFASVQRAAGYHCLWTGSKVRLIQDPQPISTYSTLIGVYRCRLRVG